MSSTGFWNQLWALKRCRRSDGSQDRSDKVFQRVQDFLDSPSVRAFQKDGLGVYGGAFGLANNVESTFLLLQSNHIGKQKSELIKNVDVIKIPYVSGTRDVSQYSELIDAMFIEQRQQQPLRSETLSASGRKAGFAPEFYAHLLLENPPSAIPRTPADRNLHRHDLLYCNCGEVMFYLYAWRLLVRWRQAECDTVFHPGDISLRDGTKPHHATMQLWDILWADEINVQLPERRWKDALNKFELEDPIYYTNVHNQWQYWSNLLDVESIDRATGKLLYPYLADWINLGLLPQDPDERSTTSSKELIIVTPALHALVVYACQACAEFRATNLLAELQPWKGVLTDSEKVSIEDVAALDIILQKTVLLVLDTKTRNNNFDALLAELHRKARFPILPYFYWVAVDQRPKSHLVFPIWKSLVFPVDVRLPSTAKDKIYADERTPIVGVCLLGVEPIKGMDWSLPGADESGTEALPDIISQIVTYYSELGSLLIDQGLYGHLVSTIVSRGGVQKSADILSHEAKHIVNALNFRWMIPIDDQIQAALGSSYDIFSNLSSAGVKWQVAPFPQLMEITGRLLKLWMQSDMVEDIFPITAPKTMEDLIYQCWKEAKDFLKPYEVYKLDLENPTSIAATHEILRTIDRKWSSGKGFNVIIASPMPDPMWEGVTAKKWMSLVRILMATFGNCVRYADAEREIEVAVDSRPVLLNHNEVIVFQIKNRQIPNAPVIPQKLGFHTRDVVKFYLEQFQGEAIYPENSSADPYIVKILLPLANLVNGGANVKY